MEYNGGWNGTVQDYKSMFYGDYNIRQCPRLSLTPALRRQRPQVRILSGAPFFLPFLGLDLLGTPVFLRCNPGEHRDSGCSKTAIHGAKMILAFRPNVMRLQSEAENHQSKGQGRWLREMLPLHSPHRERLRSDNPLPLRYRMRTREKGRSLCFA